MLDGVHDNNFDNDAYRNGNDAEITNCCKYLQNPKKFLFVTFDVSKIEEEEDRGSMPMERRRISEEVARRLGEPFGNGPHCLWNQPSEQPFQKRCAHQWQ
jgi:hypothetical protein